MMSEMGLRRVLPGQSSGSAHTFGTPRHPSVIDPILSKRVCFYKSGDPQFNGLRMVINNRTFKTFDALLDSLSKKVPLPFGVRNITTSHGVHAVSTLDDLEDGKSYICSDSRKVKAFNLARARKKLPPWYHARPASSRRRTVQQARLFPGWSIHKKEPVVLRTPKRLLVFRNGDPAVIHKVFIHKRTTPTFESILEYISELIQFHVVKLLTSDGKRVEGLPGLILCSGTVVAAGREPFRAANYSAQISPAQTTLPTNRKSIRRLKASNRKKKILPKAPKSRPFSPSCERYIVNQINNSIAERSSELRSNPSNSVEWESGHILESVAETEGETCLGDGVEGQGCSLPTDDDIEKSFRVNQDGSMTVEMKVRLTLKEEETIHWTTTLTRSSVANELNESSFPPPELEQISSPDSNSLVLQSAVASIDTINKDKSKDNNDEDPPTPCNGVFSGCSIEDDNVKEQTGLVSSWRAPTPGHKQMRTQQTSMESIQSVTAEGIQEGVVGSYSYREQTEHGDMTEQYCLVKQSSIRPIPKPRRLGSIDTNNISSRIESTFKSAGVSEILQVESSGKEVTETVLHIFEQQTCRDNFLANLCAQGMSASGIPFCRPATSETGRFSSNNESEPELWRPSTASESISLWRAGGTSLTSDLALPLLKTAAIQEANAHSRLPKPGKGRDQSLQTEIKHYKKPKLIRKRVIRLRTPKKRKKENSSEATEKRKKVKTFSSAGSLRKIYGNKSKSAKSTMKIKKGPAKNGDQGFKTKSSQQSDDTLKSILKDPNTPSAVNEMKRETEKSTLTVAPLEMIQPRGILTRQTSMHQEKKNENESYDISKSMSLPAFNSSSAFTHEYVENWLGQAHFEPTTYPDEESKKAEEVTLVKKEDGMSREAEIENSFMTKEVKCLENTSDIETCETLKVNPPPENVQASSVRQRIQSFENKPLMERTILNQQSVHSHTTPKNTENDSILAQEDTTINETSSDSSSGSPVKISLQNATPADTFSMDFPPPPSPPAEDLELSNTDYCVMDVSSAASSPLYRLSSVSSQMSDNHPLSISTSPSEKAASPTDLTMEKTTSAQTYVPSDLREAPLPRTPSIKRAPLVSNLSLGRTMALRKTCMDKYALCSDATSETSTAAAHTNVGGNDVQNGLYSTDTHQHSETLTDETQQPESRNDVKSQLCLTSASPVSLTSEERMQSTSISSDDPITPRDQSKESKCNETPAEISSPKPQVKKVQLMSSPSPERKSETRMLSSEISHKSPKLSSLHTRPPNKTMSPNTGRERHATPNASPFTEKKQLLHHQQPKLQKRLSPYSQSLDVVSPPIRQRSSKKMLSRNHSSDDTSVSSLEARRKSSSVRKNSQTPQSVKSTGEPDKTLSCDTINPVEANQSDDNKVKRSDDHITASQETETQILPQPLNTPNQPHIKSVLEDICYSIKSIRLITQTKRPSCLERSNSLPDFSSHVASTFGSSSKALLAFLAVMTLKEGLTNLNMDEQNADNVSCAEALKMIDSLKEIASIEDSHKLKDSLSTLQQSASKQLLQSWTGFQELSDKCKSRSSTPYDSEQEYVSQSSPEKDCGIDENIDKIMDNLDMPEKLKEELASLSLSFKSDNDEKEKTCGRIIREMEPPLNKDINTKLSHLSTEATKTDKDVSHEEKAHFNVSSIIKQFTEQSKQSRAETVKHRLPDQPIKENKGHYGQNSVATSPPAEPGVSQLYSTELSVKENTKGAQSCYEGEEKQQQDNNRDKSSKDWANMNRVSSNKDVERDGCTSEVREQEKEGGQLQMHSEESLSAPDNELTHHDDLGPELEGQSMSSANKGFEVSCDGGGSSSDERHSAEEGAGVECEEIQQESKERDDSGKPESCSEVKEDKQLRFSYSVEEPSNQVALSYSASPFNSEEEISGEGGLMGQSVSVDDSTCNSDVDEPTSEEEQHEAECQDHRVMNEESLSNDEDEQESTVEEEHIDDLLDHEENTEVCKSLKALTAGTVEDKNSSEEEDYLTDKIQICDKTRSKNTVGDLSRVIENQGLYNMKDKSHLIKLSADEDSGNDHTSCVEHVEAIEERISSSNEEELRCYGKDSSSEEEHIIMDIYVEENCVEIQETVAFAAQSGDTKCEKAVEKPKHHSKETISQTVAERVTLLEKKVADGQTRKNSKESSPKRSFSQRNVPLEPKVVDSPKSQSAPCSRSAPQSSLSFSYDSTGVITKEPEGNRVRSIREMFLAKSATDIPQGHRPVPSPNSSELVELRAQTSTSAGYQSQTSSELSSSEDDSAQKSISKGFVRRTIERLYGMRNANTDQEANERPPSPPKETKKERPSIFSPFHLAQSKALPELSYFNSTSPLDNLTEATRCIAFNAKVVPGHCVSINNELFLLGETTHIKKSVSDPVGINKAFTNAPQGEGMDSEEKSSYSLPSKKSELEDKELSLSRKCTYFSLPHASDSDAWQEDVSVVSKGSANGDSVIDTKDDSEDTKKPAERNGMLPNVGVTDFKKMDNKVHPLVELPPDGEVVVAQPGRGHGVMNRRRQDPDMLDVLYDFCGQNCPVL